MSAATSSIDSTVDSRDLAVRMSVLDAATSYCSRGWSVLPVPYREKNPGLNGWQKLRLKGNDLTAHFNGKPGNIGVLLGEPSGWLIDVDLDHQFCVDMADEYLPPTPLVFGRPGKPRSHWLFKVTAPLPSKRFRSKSAGSLVEIRSTGMQTVFPPSVHESGESIDWVDPDAEPVTVDPEQLFEAVEKLANAARVKLGERASTKAPREAAVRTRAAVHNDKAIASAIELALSEQRCRKFLESCPKAISGQGGHGATLRAACECFRFGLDDAAAARVMRWFNEARTDGERWTEDELAHKLASARQKVEEANELGSRLRRPTILTPGPHTDDQQVYVEVPNPVFTNAVIEKFPPNLLYKRAHLVGYLEGPAGGQQFKQLEVDATRLVIDAHVRLAAWTRSRNKDKQVQVFKPSTRDHAGLVLAGAAQSQRVRTLRQIVPYPAYVPGWKLAKPGWNDSGVYFDASEAIAQVKPILDAGQIHAILEDLLVDFPFRTPANRDNAVGMLLTPVVQPAIAGNIPMHPVVAPLERTGKTKLACDLMGHIFKGVSIAPVQFPPNEEEIEKRILAELLRDGGFVVLDNIRTVVDSPALASLLTSRLFTGRLLGKSLMVTLPNNLIVLGTGNNIITSGEIAKRSIPIHLQPPNDHPEDRVDFKHPDLFEYLASVRSVVLGALLGAVELWIAAGRPPHPNRCRLGGFEEWSDVVGGVLHGVGFTEWRANERNWRRAADPRGEDLKAFVLEWWNRFGMTPMPARDLSWVARELGLFLDCFARASEHAQTQAFVAKALTCNIDRPVEEFVIRRDNYGSSSRYYLDKVT